MHESRLVTNLMDEAVRIAEISPSEKVQEVKLSIGALSHVTPPSLESHMKEAAHGTLINDAAFTITKATDLYAADALDVRLVSMRVGEG